MIYFPSRSKARMFASKSNRKVLDLLAKDAILLDVFKVSAGMQKRWAVKVL